MKFWNTEINTWKEVVLCQEGTLFHSFEPSSNSTMLKALEETVCTCSADFSSVLLRKHPRDVSTEHMTSISSCWRMGTWMANAKAVPCAFHSPSFQPCEQVTILLNATQKRDSRAGRDKTRLGKTDRTKGRKDTRAGGWCCFLCDWVGHRRRRISGVSIIPQSEFQWRSRIGSGQSSWGCRCLPQRGLD